MAKRRKKKKRVVRRTSSPATRYPTNMNVNTLTSGPDEATMKARLEAYLREKGLIQ